MNDWKKIYLLMQMGGGFRIRYPAKAYADYQQAKKAAEALGSDCEYTPYGEVKILDIIYPEDGVKESNQ